MWVWWLEKEIIKSKKAETSKQIVFCDIKGLFLPKGYSKNPRINWLSKRVPQDYEDLWIKKYLIFWEGKWKNYKRLNQHTLY